MTLKDEIIENERKMWDSFTAGDAEGFGKLVSDDALMVCGGFRESGEEFGKIVPFIKDVEYNIGDFVVRKMDGEMVLVNYVSEVVSPDPAIAGKFRVTSLWKKTGDAWKIVFNQDSKLAEQ